MDQYRAVCPYPARGLHLDVDSDPCDMLVVPGGLLPRAIAAGLVSAAHAPRVGRSGVNAGSVWFVACHLGVHNQIPNIQGFTSGLGRRLTRGLWFALQRSFE